MADTLAERLAAIREREQAATPGPWWSDQDERVYRLHGVHATIPPQMFPGTDEVMIPEQVMNHQILKAPKSGTSYAEYWPGAADDAFITHARTDVPRLLAVADKVTELAAEWEREAVRADQFADKREGIVSMMLSARAQSYSDCARALREAVASALAAEPDSSRPAPSAPPGSSETESAYVLRRLAGTAASLPVGAPPLTGAERDHLGAEFRREYREARAPGKDTPS